MELYDILTKEQQAAGLSVYDDEDMVYLTLRGKVLAVWLARKATRTIIRNEAQKILQARYKKPAYSPGIVPPNL